MSYTVNKGNRSTRYLIHVFIVLSTTDSTEETETVTLVIVRSNTCRVFRIRIFFYFTRFDWVTRLYMFVVFVLYFEENLQ